jgi:hypothetical protein
VIFLLVPAGATAQWRRCEPPDGIGAAAGLLILDAPIDPALAGVSRSGAVKATGNGLEGSVHVATPIAGAWGVTIEATSGRMAVATREDPAGPYDRTGDTAAFRRFVGGILKAQESHGLCSYVGIKVGLYRYSYRGVSLNAGGGSALMGFEVPASDANALFFELELSVGLTRMRTPLASDPVAVNIRPVVGFRHRF